MAAEEISSQSQSVKLQRGAPEVTTFEAPRSFYLLIKSMEIYGLFIR
jgi:hypothetical protein